MKKKITVISILVILLTLLVSASLAYFRSQDEVKNTFTIGDIKILQHEKEYDASGKLQDFTQGQYLYPVVNVNNPSEDKYYVDKLVSVENVGSNDAYVRTFIAVPKALKEVVCLDVNEDNWIKDDVVWPTISLNNIEYYVVSYTYKNILESKDTTEYVLEGIYMDSRVDLQMNNNVNAKQFCIEENGGYRFFDFDVNQAIEVHVISAACQTRGLGSDPQVALNSAFGNSLPSFN